MGGTGGCTLTDLILSCPGSLLKTTPPPPGYPWVSESRFRVLMLDHQFLKELDLKKTPKRTRFDQKQQFWGAFLALAPLNLDG